MGETNKFTEKMGLVAEALMSVAHGWMQVREAMQSSGSTVTIFEAVSRQFGRVGRALAEVGQALLIFKDDIEERDAMLADLLTAEKNLLEEHERRLNTLEAIVGVKGMKVCAVDARSLVREVVVGPDGKETVQVRLPDEACDHLERMQAESGGEEGEEAPEPERVEVVRAPDFSIFRVPSGPKQTN